eukprot:COSAG02_NODE_1088_length_14670_cov_237.088326_9_plen_69_part_00
MLRLGAEQWRWVSKVHTTRSGFAWHRLLMKLNFARIWTRVHRVLVCFCAFRRTQLGSSACAIAAHYVG